MPAMLVKSTKWRVKLWIACFAILMNALAPSISHALAFASSDVRGEICRTDAAARATPQVTAPVTEFALMADCGYCLSHAGSYSLMPTTITGLAILGGHELRPFLFYRAPQPLLMLSAAPPRGPPAAL